MKRLIFLLFALITFFNQVHGQTFNQQFNDLVLKKDTAGQIQLLKKWEEADNNNADLYMAYFNYYMNHSKQNNNLKSKNVGNSQYNQNLVRKGVEYADKGITQNPTRLDIHLAKINMFSELSQWNNLTTEIIKMIDYSAVIKNNWTGINNKRVDNPKTLMLNSILLHQVKLYNTNNAALLNNMQQIAETILKYYPDHVESITDLSIIYRAKKDSKKTLEELLKVEKLDLNNPFVLSNIAYEYKLKGDNKNALKYYELTLKQGEESTKKNAQEQIDKLKKKLKK